MFPVKPFLRTAYNYDTNEASDESGLLCEDASLAKQSFLEETDINTIVRRFGLTGEVPTGLRLPSYADFDGVTDFHSAMNAIAGARESFDKLPPEMRARFQNDPQGFVAFCSDEANRGELIKMKLVPEPAMSPPPPGGAPKEAGAPAADVPVK